MQTKQRRRYGDPTGTVILGGGERTESRKVLAYGLVPFDTRGQPWIHETPRFDLHDVPFCHSDSFLDFDGVITQAVAFDDCMVAMQVLNGLGVHDPATAHAIFQPIGTPRRLSEDIARRTHEIRSLLSRGGFVIILVPRLVEKRVQHGREPTEEVLTVLMNEMKIKMSAVGQKPSTIEVPEFGPFLERFGAAGVEFSVDSVTNAQVTSICSSDNGITGFAIDNNLFMLPYAVPSSHDMAVDVAVSVAECAMTYRERIAIRTPAWLRDFQFSRESELRAQLAGLEAQLSATQSELSLYEKYKVALIAKSDPLVNCVLDILRGPCRLGLSRDEKFIDDAQIMEDGEVAAVVEIKGESGSFKREHVNQVDSHRERLGLPTTRPGLLIMNTKMKSSSLSEKEDPPHPDIIRKAVTENVLLIRTLDLLRYVDLIERNLTTAADFRGHVLRSRGWLRVQDDCVEVVQE